MSRLQTCLIGCVIFCCAPTATAGVLNGYAGALQSGRTDFQGFTDYPTNTPGKETGLFGYIEWAVFAPGVLPAGFSGSFIPSSSEYVYSYQVFEVGTAPLSFLGVSLGNIATQIGYFVATGISGEQPALSQILPSQANWTFGENGVAAGGQSEGLFFTSPYAPTLLEGVVQDDGSSAAVVPLPSPAPEPGTIVCWSCGIVFCAVRTLRRRGRKVGFFHAGPSAE